MVPWTSSRARFVALGAAYVAGRTANVLNNSMRFPIPGIDDFCSSRMLNDDLTLALAKARHTSSTAAFDDVVFTGSQLGSRNELALKVQVEEFVFNHRNDTNQAGFMHGAAALAGALGDTLLNRGNRLDSADHVLSAGDRLDLGGCSLRNYMASAELLGVIQRRKGETEFSAHVDDLARSSRCINNKIEQIYSRHDIEKTFVRLCDKYRLDPGTLLIYESQLARQVKQLPASTTVTDPKFVAKLCRDVALIDFAIANGSRNRNVDDAAASGWLRAGERFLRGARRWSPDAPDLQSLEKIAADLHKKADFSDHL
jgi:hypothetical protein